MTFRDDYPVLSNFLICWFPETDFDGLEDNEIVPLYIPTCSRKELEVCLSEGERVLALGTFPTEAVSLDANRYFTSDEAARTWLAEIMRQLREELSR